MIAAIRHRARWSALTLKLSEAIRDLNAEESVDALRADVQATIDFINEHILTDVEGIRPGKVTELKEL